MKEIELTQGKVALIDDEDWEKVNQYRWHAIYNNKCWYARNSICSKGKNRGRRHMHRLVMDARLGQQIDHINGNGLDNRKENLRFCTRSQNQANGHMNQGGTSRYKGVYWERKRLKWRAHIYKDSCRIHLGYFDNEEDAACAYDQAARELFGDFAKYNFEGEKNS